MADIDIKYHNLLRHIKEEGFEYEDPKRKGVFRKQIHSYKIFHDFKTEGFPAITTKKLYWNAVVGELIWFLRGDTNIKYLIDNNINIWNKDAYNWFLKKNILPEDRENHKKIIENLNEYLKGNNVDLGRIYGAQWRSWYVNRDFSDFESGQENFETLDQIERLIKNLINQPMATDHIVNSWNPAELKDMALPPCHNYFQILPRPLTPAESSEYFIPRTGELENYPTHGFILSFNMRSVDTFLGLPFNLASYALLAYIIGKITNMQPLGLEADLHNVHIYKDHMNSVDLQLSRDIHKFANCRMNGYITDKILGKDFNSISSESLTDLFNEFEITDFELEDYKSYPTIKEKMIARDE